MGTDRIAPTRVSSHLARDGSWQPCIQNPCNPPQVCFARFPLIKMRCPSLLAPLALLVGLAIPSLDALAAQPAPPGLPRLPGLPGLPGVPGLALLACLHFVNAHTYTGVGRFVSIWLHLDTFLSRSGSHMGTNSIAPARVPSDLAQAGSWQLSRAGF